MPKTARKPSYLLHKPTGQARVRIDGTDHNLGQYGSRESHDRYEALVSECLKGRDVDVFSLTVDELALRYLSHCDAYYRTLSGRPTGETSNVRAALRYAVSQCGTVRVRDFGPLKLKAVRTAMIKAGISRKYINASVNRIRRMFRWGVEEEIVPGEVSRDLEAVAGLREGRSEAVEAEPVKPVPEAFIDAVQPFVSRQIWGMIQTQLFAGMRPGEVLSMRGCDLNMTGRIWEYVPATHKTAHHGRRRVIFLGPRAQAVVREFLTIDLSSFLFSPTEAVAELQKAKRAARKTPVQPSQVDRRKQGAKRKPGAKYTRLAYANAIRRACVKAGIPHWHPHQLRHNAATSLRRGFGIEAARTVLGHASVVTSEIYAEKDFDKARDIISQVG